MELVTRLTELIYSNLIREDRFRLLFDGLGLTLQITLYALCMGVVIGVVIAVARIMKMNMEGLQRLLIYLHPISMKS